MSGLWLEPKFNVLIWDHFSLRFVHEILISLQCIEDKTYIKQHSPSNIGLCNCPLKARILLKLKTRILLEGTTSMSTESLPWPSLWPLGHQLPCIAMKWTVMIISVGMITNSSQATRMIHCYDVTTIAIVFYW